MIKFLIGFFIFFVFHNNGFANQSKPKEKIIYEYKKFEKFNLEEISVDGETGVPGDISIINRFKRNFDNKLPYRKNFRPEVILSVERIQ